MKNPFPRMHRSFNDLFAWIERIAAPAESYVDHDLPVSNAHDPEQWPEPLVIGDTTLPYHYWVTNFEAGKSVTLELHPDSPDGRPPQFVLHTPDVLAAGIAAWNAAHTSGTWTNDNTEAIAKSLSGEDPRPWKIQLVGADGKLGDPVMIPANLVVRDVEVIDAWMAWALPAILDVLAGHIPFDVDNGPRISCYHPSTGNAESFEDWEAWREHVGPYVASRVACDPQRAIAALQTLL